MLTPEHVFKNEFGYDEISDMDLSQSPIRNYFKGKTVLITGATGFVGQLLLEKLLRCDIERAYVVARVKKNQSPEERFNKLFAGKQFQKLHEHNPNFKKSLTILLGDMTKVNLGLSSAQIEELKEEVQIIFHAAADVRFNERIYDLVLTNLRGTQEILKLAEQFRKLQVFNYISTAYSHCSHGYHVKEDFYDPPIDPEIIISYVKRCQDNPLEFEHLEYITEKLLGDWPNTYTFSKALSEELIRRQSDKFPICVVRPSIIISTYQEPMPAWCNNFFGLNGVFFAYGAGIMRLTFAKRFYHLDVVCADFVVNGILASTWDTYLNYKESLKNTSKVYAIVACEKFISVDLLLRTTTPLNRKYPPSSAIWCVCPNVTACPFLFWYLTIFYHFIANVFFDCGLALMRHPLRLIPIFRKIQTLGVALTYFQRNQWEFDNTNMKTVWDKMDPIDKKLFRCDTRQFEFERWGLTFIQGLKYYLANENLSVESARSKYRLFKVAHFFVRIIFYLLQASIIYVLLKPFGVFDYFQNFIVHTMEITKRLINFG